MWFSDINDKYYSKPPFVTEHDIVASRQENLNKLIEHAQEISDVTYTDEWLTNSCKNYTQQYDDITDVQITNCIVM